VLSYLRAFVTQIWKVGFWRKRFLYNYKCNDCKECVTVSTCLVLYVHIIQLMLTFTRISFGLCWKQGSPLLKWEERLSQGCTKFFKNLETTSTSQVPEECHEASSVWGFTNIWRHIQHLFAMVNLCARFLHPWFVHGVICDWVLCHSMLFYVQGIVKKIKKLEISTAMERLHFLQISGFFFF
jgi:hypothetical protein